MQATKLFSTFVSVIALSSAVSTVWANNDSIQPFLTLTGGMGLMQAGDPQTYNSSSGTNSYTYVPNKTYQPTGLYGATVGIEIPLTRNHTTLQLGVAFNQINPYTIKGVNSADSTLYNYQYNVSSQQVLAQAKLLFTINDYYHPYLVASVGQSYNRSYSYQTTQISNDINPNVTPSYADNRNTALSFSGTGFGVDVDVAKHVRAGIGYQLIDLGRTNLGAGKTVITIPYSLSQSHSFANEIVGQLTFIF